MYGCCSQPGCNNTEGTDTNIADAAALACLNTVAMHNMKYIPLVLTRVGCKCITLHAHDLPSLTCLDRNQHIQHTLSAGQPYKSLHCMYILHGVIQVEHITRAKPHRQAGSCGHLHNSLFTCMLCLDVQPGARN